MVVRNGVQWVPSAALQGLACSRTYTPDTQHMDRRGSTSISSIRPTAESVSYFCPVSAFGGLSLLAAGELDVHRSQELPNGLFVDHIVVCGPAATKPV